MRKTKLLCGCDLEDIDDRISFNASNFRGLIGERIRLIGAYYDYIEHMYFDSTEHQHYEYMAENINPEAFTIIDLRYVILNEVNFDVSGLDDDNVMLLELSFNLMNYMHDIHELARNRTMFDRSIAEITYVSKVNHFKNKADVCFEDFLFLNEHFTKKFGEYVSL